MSSVDDENVHKRQRTTDDDEEEDDDEIVVTKVVKAPPKPQNGLKQVYIVFTCDYPLQNDKWGEHSGHETQDTKLIGTYANLRDANAVAKAEAFYDEDGDGDDEDEDEVDEHGMFYWQDEEPHEWEARRVWVDKQTIHY